MRPKIPAAAPRRPCPRPTAAAEPTPAARALVRNIAINAAGNLVAVSDAKNRIAEALSGGDWGTTVVN